MKKIITLKQTKMANSGTDSYWVNLIKFVEAEIASCPVKYKLQDLGLIFFPRKKLILTGKRRNVTAIYCDIIDFCENNFEVIEVKLKEGL
jgi:hypothetical protein